MKKENTNKKTRHLVEFFGFCFGVFHCDVSVIFAYKAKI